MQKQKKNLNFRRTNKPLLRGWSKKEIRRNKSRLRKRRIFKNKLYVLNPTFRQLMKTKKLGALSKKLNIRVTPNNVFCTLKNITKNKTTYVGSSGIYKVKTSKKTLRYSTKVVVGYFLGAIKKELNSKRFVVNIVGPIRTRKAILKQLAKYFKRSSLILNVESKKCFNGCRPPKKKRKKQKGLRVFK
jgi:ribosomal protein S11